MLFFSVNNQDKWGHEIEISLTEPGLFFGMPKANFGSTGRGQYVDH